MFFVQTGVDGIAILRPLTTDLQRFFISFNFGNGLVLPGDGGGRQVTCPSLQQLRHGLAVLASDNTLPRTVKLHQLTGHGVTGKR